MEKETQDHNWEHPGIQHFSRNGGKWEPWARVIISFILGTLSAAFLLGGKSRDISDLQSWKTQMETWKERVDKEGTNRSHWTDDKQSEQISANLVRVIELERRDEQRDEKMNVMAGKIERLEREVEIAKDRGPK